MGKLLLQHFVYWFYRLLSWSWRKKVVEHPEFSAAIKNNEPLIFAHWHGDELVILFLVPRYRCATMVSTSSDGDLANYVFCRLGGQTSRGSSTRGAVGALKGLVRLIKSGAPASIAVDGPKGPLHVAKPGVFELSRLADAKISAVGVHAPQSFVFKKSWNKALLPKPFSKVLVYFDKPIPIVSREQDPRDPKLAENLQQLLFGASQQASKLFAQF